MKLINTKPNETADEAIVRCANNLVKAVLASGRSIHSTSGVSGLEITFYNYRKGDIVVKNILSGWNVWGKTPLKITFRPDESELVQAERDGRCVVLPCKVGDTVYEALFEWDCTECLKTSFKPKVRERKVTHFVFGKSGDIIVGVSGDGADYLIYGKTVFLTRAEAEEALKGGTA